MPFESGADAHRWGIEPGYHDVDGRWHDADPDAVAVALAAMGARTEAPEAPEDRDVWVVGAGQAVGSAGPWRLRTESGQTLEGHDLLPGDLGLGYHDLERDAASRQIRLIVSPLSCPRPTRSWGWAAQLYALRSRQSWGIGDLGDLATFGTWARSVGASEVLVNPLHAGLPGHPQPDSPYFPSSRVFRSPLYIRVEDVPGADVVADVAKAAEAGRALNTDRLIDRDAVWRLKRSALEALWRRGLGAGEQRSYDAYRAEHGEAIEDYATFCALHDVHGTSWRLWPESFRRPRTAPVLDFARAHSDAVSFHAWLQYLIDAQMRRAGASIDVVTDLAVGTDPDGADAWRWQDLLVDGVTVGAPPDEFNRNGQNWGFAPFDPWKLRREGFQPFIDVLRAGFGHAAGMRIDHVAGLFRLWWIPAGSDGSTGVYVRGPWDELLAITALESTRAGAWVVGEDLGTVPPLVREEMARRGLLSTRVMWFEPEAPPVWPDTSLAAVTTHDLATVAGLWTGADDRDQSEAGIVPNTDASAAIRLRLAEWTGLPSGAGVDDAVLAAHRLLSSAPSTVALAGLDDALGVPTRCNLPGTTDRANWRSALPLPLEELVDDPLVRQVAEVMGEGR